MGRTSLAARSIKTLKATPGFEKSFAAVDQQTRVLLVLSAKRFGTVIQDSTSLRGSTGEEV